MVILIALAVVCAPFLLTTALRARRARAPHAEVVNEGHAEVGTVTGIASYDRPTWSALDDRQLTRLLISSAPRSTTE